MGAGKVTEKVPPLVDLLFFRLSSCQGFPQVLGGNITIFEQLLLCPLKCVLKKRAGSPRASVFVWPL